MTKPSDLLLRAARGLVLLIVAMLAVMLTAAGSARFWPAYALVATFTLVSLAVTADLARRDPALLERRLSAGPGAEKDPAQRRIMTIASLIFMAMLALPGFDHRFGWSHSGAATVLFGHLLIVVAYAGIAWVFRTNSYAAGTIGVFEGHHVVASGPYRFVRHPMYLASLFLFAGLPLALGSWPSLALLIPAALAIGWRTLEEERYLAEHLPGYAAYRDVVRWRIIPGLW